MKPLLLCLAITMADSHPAAATERSRAARSAFHYEHPCPATGDRKGRCPGYVVDHINPLACGGADAPDNMQWQTISQASAKDRWERIACRIKMEEKE